ncbi:uncharacterized protein EAF01_005199 [Botrytis porri]|uniref:uncharacterized protein n=1 Tax=Botrytis porri TaxID=87229 RepID=UPI0019005D2D|nr:uncharacterized protein EAF01_005199 [Botrytis porri]KAF7907613.1 hypothetical protein EAF01_005199 [Botrytis porri]
MYNCCYETQEVDIGTLRQVYCVPGLENRCQFSPLLNHLPPPLYLSDLLSMAQQPVTQSTPDKEEHTQNHNVFLKMFD